MSVVNIPEENSSSLLTNSTVVTRQHLITQNPNPSLPKNTDNISHHLSPAYYNFNSHHTTNLLSLNPHLANVGDDVKSTTRSSEFIDQRPGLGISSRWSPTPEQLIALEEMYRRGTRTPSAEQIQHIASQLRRFGKIEGKNVFYWFQNHKARERQKRRRREMETYDNNLSDQEKHHNNNNNNTHHSVPAEKKESGLRKTSYDIGQTRKWGPSSNSEQQEQQHRVSDISSSSSTTCSGPQSYCNGWSQFDQRECQVQQIRKLTTTKVMNAAWQEMECLPSPLECNTKFLKIDPRHHHHHHQNYLSGFSFLNMKPNNYQQQENGEETQTLELFPLHDNNIKDDDDGDGNSDVNGTKKVPITAINDTNNYSPSSFQYIEFLPLKKTEAQN